MIVLNMTRKKAKSFDPEANEALLLLSIGDRETLKSLKNQIVSEAMSGRIPKEPVLSKEEQAALERFGQSLSSKEK